LGQALPFSEIDQYLKKLNLPVQGCLVDTQFLIAVTDELHPFYEDAEFLFEKLAEYHIPVFTTVTTRTEFVDTIRRFIITETLMGMLSASSKWRISASVQRVLRAQKTWIDTQAKNDALPLLTDSRIKNCKESFMPRSQSGQIGWILLCNEYLSGKLFESWNALSEELNLNYLDLRGEELSPYMNEKVQWHKMYSISEQTCLSSNDSMLLNVLNCSKFPFIVSADFDIAYSVLASSNDKATLIPDNLHYKKIKSLQF
jgi:predicted nucleic acid-binding protein